MLVLSRKETETIICETRDGTQIKIAVVRISGKIVRVGIEAPADVTLWRGEIDHVEGGDRRIPAQDAQ